MGRYQLVEISGPGLVCFFHLSFFTLSWLNETENGFMEPKYLSFRFGDCTPLALIL